MFHVKHRKVLIKQQLHFSSLWDQPIWCRNLFDQAKIALHQTKF